MLTNNVKKTETLTRYGIKVLGTKAIVIESGENIELKKSLDEKGKSDDYF